MNIPVQSCNGSNGNRISLTLSFCLCFRLCLSFSSPAPTSQRKNMDSMDSSAVRSTRMVDSSISYTLESNSRYMVRIVGSNCQGEERCSSCFSHWFSFCSSIGFSSGISNSFSLPPFPANSNSHSRPAAKTCFIHPWSSNTRPLELLSRNNSNVVGKYREDRSSFCFRCRSSRGEGEKTGEEEELHDEEYEPPTDLLGQ